MAYAYASLTNPQNTGSGIAEFILLAPVTAFTDDGIKCPAAPFTNPGDEVTIKQAHQFKPGEGFIKVQLAPQKNKLDATTIGDFGFTKLDINLDVFIPGSYAEVHEAVKNWLNKPLIILSKDGDCKANMYYQLGCDCASAWLKVDFSTGTTVDGIKGYNGKLNYQNGYIQVYMGPAPQIKGSSSTPVIYNTVLTFESSNQAAMNGVTATISSDPAVTDSVKKFEIDSISPVSGTGLFMNLKIGSTLEMVIDTKTGNAGKNFRFTDSAGVVHTGQVLNASGDKVF